MTRVLDPKDKYYIDNPGRVKAIQTEMHKRGIDVYLGSRIRTMIQAAGHARVVRHSSY